MRYLTIGLLLLAVTVGTQACCWPHWRWGPL